MHSLLVKKKSKAAGKAQVVRGVVHQLIKGRWQGGDRLTEIQAAEMFQLSRTPVREGLMELAAMGILELRQNCGAIFLPFGEKELSDLYAVRALLEVEATRLATTAMDGSLIEQLKTDFEILRRANLPDMDWKLDFQLHNAIAQCCGNPRLAGEIARYGNLVQTMREAVVQILEDIHTTSLSEHLRILRALKERDPEAAAEAMRLHLIQAAESAVQALRTLRHRT